MDEPHTSHLYCNDGCTRLLLNLRLGERQNPGVQKDHEQNPAENAVMQAKDSFLQYCLIHLRNWIKK